MSFLYVFLYMYIYKSYKCSIAIHCILSLESMWKIFDIWLVEKRESAQFFASTKTLFSQFSIFIDDLKTSTVELQSSRHHLILNHILYIWKVFYSYISRVKFQLKCTNKTEKSSQKFYWLEYFHTMKQQWVVEIIWACKSFSNSNISLQHSFQIDFLTSMQPVAYGMAFQCIIF